MAYMAFAPLCAPGSVDFPTLLKLLEGTFRLDLAAARDYCAADERCASLSHASRCSASLADVPRGGVI